MVPTPPFLVSAKPFSREHQAHISHPGAQRSWERSEQIKAETLPRAAEVLPLPGSSLAAGIPTTANEAIRENGAGCPATQRLWAPRGPT